MCVHWNFHIVRHVTGTGSGLLARLRPRPPPPHFFASPIPSPTPLFFSRVGMFKHLQRAGATTVPLTSPYDPSGSSICRPLIHVFFSHFPSSLCPWEGRRVAVRSDLYNSPKINNNSCWLLYLYAQTNFFLHFSQLAEYPNVSVSATTHNLQIRFDSGPAQYLCTSNTIFFKPA